MKEGERESETKREIRECSEPKVNTDCQVVMVSVARGI